MVLRPEVDHFNSASRIFFKKDSRPGDLRTGDRWVNLGRPAWTRVNVNTANVSHALIPPEHYGVPPHNHTSMWCWAVCVFVCFCQLLVWLSKSMIITLCPALHKVWCLMHVISHWVVLSLVSLVVSACPAYCLNLTKLFYWISLNIFNTWKYNLF